MPIDRQRINVLVTTACSACSETASTAINVPGNMNPCPILLGIKNSKYAQFGKPLCMLDNPTVPINRRMVPTTKGGFKRLV